MVRTQLGLGGSLLLASVLVACGSDDASDPGGGQDPAVLDDLAQIPDTPPDSLRIDFPEQIIGSGEERMTCFYPEPTDEEYFVHSAHAYQGEYGHHLLLFKTITPKTPGTIEDCTDEASMAAFLPNIFTSEFAGGDIPDGYAVRVPAGTQIVIQQHYVNTTAKPIRVRDAVFLNKIDASSVQHELGFVAMTDIDFSIPPHASGYDLSVECTPPEDGVEVLLLGPHMHEWGQSIRVEKSTDGGTTWQSIQDIAEWQPVFRDLPPVQRYFDAPLTLNESDKLRVTCSYDNDRLEPLGFPQEMCAYYGYFLSPSASASWICLADD